MSAGRPPDVRPLRLAKSPAANDRRAHARKKLCAVCWDEGQGAQIWWECDADLATAVHKKGVPLGLLCGVKVFAELAIWRDGEVKGVEDTGQIPQRRLIVTESSVRLPVQHEGRLEIIHIRAEAVVLRVVLEKSVRLDGGLSFVV